MTRIKWYLLLVLRIGTAALLAVVLGWIVYRSSLPNWLQMVIDILIINGLVVGSLIIGPISYRQHRRSVDRIHEELKRQELTDI